MWTVRLSSINADTFQELPVVYLSIVILIAISHNLINITAQELIRDVWRLQNFFEFLFRNRPTVVPVKRLENILQVVLIL